MKKIALISLLLSTSAMAGGVDCNGKVFVVPNMQDHYPYEAGQRANGKIHPLPGSTEAYVSKKYDTANIYSWYAMDNLGIAPATSKAEAEYLIQIENHQVKGPVPGEPVTKGVNYLTDKVLGGNLFDTYSDKVSVTLVVKETGEKFVASEADTAHAIDSNSAEYPALLPLTQKAMTKVLGRFCRLDHQSRPAKTDYRCQSDYAGRSKVFEQVSVTRTPGLGYNYTVNFQPAGSPAKAMAQCHRLTPVRDMFNRFARLNCSGDLPEGIAIDPEYRRVSGGKVNLDIYLNSDQEVVSISNPYPYGSGLGACYRDLPVFAKKKNGRADPSAYESPAGNEKSGETDAN